MAAVAVGALGGGTPASASVEVRPDLRPGDVVRVGDLGVTVPDPGRWAVARALAPTGEAPELAVTTDDDGLVVLAVPPLEADEGGSGPEDALVPQTLPAPPVDAAALGELDSLVGAGLETGASSSPAACDDGAYNLGWFYFGDGTRKHYKWKSTMGWRFNTTTTPSELTAAAAGDAINRATSNITGQDGCSLEDQVSASHSYLGAGFIGVNYANGVCGTGDGQSMVVFGDLRPAYYGWTCAWGFKDAGETYAQATESDVKLNKDDYVWYTSEPSSCRNRWSLEAGMTHERGHTFGLGHVSEETHGKLTMSPLMAPCQDSESSLGLGDIRGLRTLY